MTIQLIFRRGNYSGNWVKTDGSLEILYKGVRKIIFRDTNESVAETVFVDYVFPIPHEIAQDIVDHLTSHQGIDYQNALQSAIADYGLRPDHIDSVKWHLITLLQADRFDTSELDEVGVGGGAEKVASCFS